MLHREQIANSENTTTGAIPDPASKSVTSKCNDSELVVMLLAANRPVNSSNILLATALVRVHASNGRSLQLRARLDQGSTWTFLSEKAANALFPRTRHVSASVVGVGGVSAGTVTRAADIIVTPRDSDQPESHTCALILKKLTSYVSTPSSQSVINWPHLRNLRLADPNPKSSDPIDLILGSDLYGHLLLDGLIKGSANQPIAQNSAFWWVLSGWTSSPPSDVPSQLTVHHCIDNKRLSFDLQKFWEIENGPTNKSLTADDESCENHFKGTFSRTTNGRYMVRLPLRTSPPEIGKSRDHVLYIFRSLGKRLSRNPDDAFAYREIMDYEWQAHMSPVGPPEAESLAVYLPHHGVKKETSTTTKLRVVFNASYKTSNSTSLNDHLLTGRKLQADLGSVLLQWQIFQFVYCADIAQMYRQIVLDPRDRDLQRTVWRTSPDAPLQDYQLTTITFGVSCAPYLALRVLKQLVEDHGSLYPLASQVLRHGLYVDDCLFGANDFDEAQQTRDQLNALLNCGQFHLRKWASNSPHLLADIDPVNHGLASERSFYETEGLKILGVLWNPSRDSYQFKINLISSNCMTKRSLLSIISRFFDPLGWVSPVILRAKLFIQRLWLLHQDWDDRLPDNICVKWKSFYETLPALASFVLPRWTGQNPLMEYCELHGFSDASSAAYAAVVYLRVVNPSAPPKIIHLASRTKVAPVKTQTVPRLELCAAVLLARLIHSVIQINEFINRPIYCWSDATIVLHWLRDHPNRWKQSLGVTNGASRNPLATCRNTKQSG